jgi:hypothetical protein
VVIYTIGANGSRTRSCGCIAALPGTGLGRRGQVMNVKSITIILSSINRKKDI